MSKQESALNIFREEILKRDVLHRFGFVLAQSYGSDHIKYNCIVDKNLVLGAGRDTCGLYYFFEHRAEETPVAYARDWRGKEWIVKVNPSFNDLDQDQRNITFVYAMSRAYAATNKVSLVISDLISDEEQERLSKLTDLVKGMKK